MRITRRKTLISVLLLGIFLTLFSSVLSVMSFRKMQANNYVHSVTLYTVSAIQKLNYALGFGKPLDKYYGLDTLLGEVMELSDAIQTLEVVDEGDTGILTVGEMEEEIRQSSVGEEYQIRRSGIYAFSPFDRGMIIIRLDLSPINILTRDYALSLLLLNIVILAAVTVASFIIFSCLDNNGIDVKQMRLVCILLLSAAQLILGVFAMVRMDRACRESTAEIVRTTAHMVENDINTVIKKGVSYDEITGIDEYLADLAADIPEISSLTIGDDREEAAPITGFEMKISGPGNAPILLSLHYCYDQGMIRERMFNHVIDILLPILITVFISLEAAGFLTKHLECRHAGKGGELYLPGFRLFVFAEGIAFTLDGGFFSILSRKLYQAMELPDSMLFLSGMPNAMYSAAVVISLVFSRSLLQRYGIKRVLSAGVGTGVAGYILCAIAPNLPMLIAARFIYGFCDGLLINCIRLYAASREDTGLHTRILVEYMSAINLGVSCGVVIGGLIADASSYTAVFLTGAFLGVVCLFLIRLAGFPGKLPKKGDQYPFLGSFRELRIPRVLVYMLFVVFPVYVATLFVSFSFPLFGGERGFSNSLVAGCMMLNFLIIAFLTDPITNLVLKHLAPSTAMAFYMLVQGLSIGLFVLLKSPASAILALALTSLWDCFGMVVIDLGLNHVQGASKERCILLQMLFGKLGMMTGPLLITARLGRGAAGASGVIVMLLFSGLAVYVLSGLCFSFQKKQQHPWRKR